MPNFILKGIFLLCALALTLKGKSQNFQTPKFDINVGSLVSAAPDSIYRLKAGVFTGDSLQVTSVRIVESDSSFITFDQQFILSSLPLVETAGAWEDSGVVIIDLPHYNPFIRKHYLLEFLGSGGQLLLQIEKEF